MCSGGGPLHRFALANEPPEHILLQTGTLIDFEITHKEVQLALDKENILVQVKLQFKPEEDEEVEDIIEWGAFGFIFTLMVQSFDDARPRGHSDIYFEQEDQFTAGDLIEGLTFGVNGLRYHGDYVRGRSLKTTIVMNTQGVVSIDTYGRGESLLRWLDRLKGKMHLKEVE